jgi:RimJ/RimL family protein N-acetyltransferase
VIEVVPYERAHAYMVLANNINDFDMKLSSLPDWEEWTKEYENSIGYSLIINGEIIGSAGVFLGGYGRGDCWMIVTTRISKYKKTVFKTVKNMLNEIAKKYHLRRLQTVVLPEFEAGKRFVEGLGFECEGCLKKYGPNGEDFLMYGRV